MALARAAEILWGRPGRGRMTLWSGGSSQACCHAICLACLSGKSTVLANQSRGKQVQRLQQQHQWQDIQSSSNRGGKGKDEGDWGLSGKCVVAKHQQHSAKLPGALMTESRRPINKTSCRACRKEARGERGDGSTEKVRLAAEAQGWQVLKYADLYGSGC